MNADERTLLPAHEPTVLMPAPGGLATVAVKRGEGARPVAVPGAAVELQRLVAGLNPLVNAAAVLLGLVPRLRETPAHDDPAGLRMQLLDWIAQFESVAGANGVPRPRVAAARYLLCSFIDEVIEQTPWGADGAWSRRSLLHEFHEERWGGEKSFQLLERLLREPAANADLLELFFVCLQLGFEGRYRGGTGRAELDALADRVMEAIRPTADAAASRTLSLRWKGVRMREAGDATLLWLVVPVALGAALVLGLWLALNARLEDAAQPVFRALHAAPVAVGSPPATRAAARPRLAAALQAEVRRGALEVRDEAQRSVVRLPADALFVPGSAQVEAGQLALLARVAAALRDQPGQVAVIGHTDDAPVASPRFPSAWHLTRERARAVQAVLAAHGARTERLRAEGRADAEPLVPNAGAAERARNRRIEIELRLPRPDG